MTSASAETKAEISLVGHFEGVTLRRSETGALTIDLSALGGGDVTIITGGSVRFVAPPEEQTGTLSVVHASVDKRAYMIGDVLPDGWVVGPVSPDTGKPVSFEPVSGALDGYQLWHQGEDHAADLRREGHPNVRQPSDSEWTAIYNDVIKAGRNDNVRLNTRGSDPYGVYWSSTPGGLDFVAHVQYLNGGHRHAHLKTDAAARVRCVRDEPGLVIA